MTVGLTGIGTYLPEKTITGAEIAEISGTPEEVVVEKMGIREKHVCPPGDDHVTDMATKAARTALEDANLGAETLDLILYHGSEYKDHIVWNAAADIADRLGATNAYAHETYALCAGTPIAYRQTASQLQTGDIERALLVGASREEDLVNYTDEDASFMFNFGSGACASVLEADPGDRAEAKVVGHAARTDGSFARDVIMPAGGSVAPSDEETVRKNQHTLTVPDPEGMKQRLGPVSEPAFLGVADDALSAAGYDRDEIDFVALTHMKRSFHDRLVDDLGLDESGHHYLDTYGHVQSVDQLLALTEGLEADHVTPGDIVLFLAAGTGYTWAGSVLEWTGTTNGPM